MHILTGLQVCYLGLLVTVKASPGLQFSKQSQLNDIPVQRDWQYQRHSVFEAIDGEAKLEQSLDTWTGQGFGKKLQKLRVSFGDTEASLMSAEDIERQYFRTMSAMYENVDVIEDLAAFGKKANQYLHKRSIENAGKDEQNIIDNIFSWYRVASQDLTTNTDGRVKLYVVNKLYALLLENIAILQKRTVPVNLPELEFLLFTQTTPKIFGLLHDLSGSSQYPTAFVTLHMDNYENLRREHYDHFTRPDLVHAFHDNRAELHYYEYYQELIETKAIDLRIIYRPSCKKDVNNELYSLPVLLQDSIFTIQIDSNSRDFTKSSKQSLSRLGLPESLRKLEFNDFIDYKQSLKYSDLPQLNMGLVTLKIQRSGLTFTDIFRPPKTVREIYLNGNEIQATIALMQLRDDVRHLCLSHNDLYLANTMILSKLKWPRHLQSLDLQHNQLGDFIAKMSFPNGLRELNLIGNSFNFLDIVKKWDGLYLKYFTRIGKYFVRLPRNLRELHIDEGDLVEKREFHHRGHELHVWFLPTDDYEREKMLESQRHTCLGCFSDI